MRVRGGSSETPARLRIRVRDRREDIIRLSQRSTGETSCSSGRRAAGTDMINGTWVSCVSGELFPQPPR